MEDDSDHYGTFLGHEDIKDRNDYSRKWAMLAMLSMLTGINQAICYSYAPIASFAEKHWDERLRSTELITIYFISYIPCSFVGSWIMDKKGLRYGVLLGALLQAMGALVRYLAGFASSMTAEVYITVMGQVLASIAMPFMVNSPPVLSANWFPPSLRATSTSVAVNANAMGTAVVYLSAPFLVHGPEDVQRYNLVVAIGAVVCWSIAYCYFRSFPPITNGLETESVISEVQLHDEYDWKQWGNAFTHHGFWHTVVAFSIAECILNAMSALLGKFLSAEGYKKSQVGLIGAVFIVSSLFGGQLISRYVDRMQNHKHAFQVCLLFTGIFMATFKLALSYTNISGTFLSLLLVGFFLGPLQPIVLELGVECAFPTSEATVAALQQLSGNFLSAMLIPGLSTLRRHYLDSSGHVPTQFFYACPEWIMVFLLALTLMVFCFFNGEYKRFAHESALRKPLKKVHIGS